MDLAQAYLAGDNVPEDQAKAASWYIMAGENGSAEGKRRSIEITHGMAPFQIGEIRFDLGKMYMNGIGAARDYVSAYAWFELAKAAGDIRAQAEENALEPKMDPGQVQEARQRASQWLQSHSRKASVSHSGR
jgi:TPR repeat protein